ncbi:plasmid mobilization protein [Helicobacter valdiviensis]|uniref:plasmid mobilization protein n=1 Tax=Helicobacter valdiviensis TaxID=1458358 RepID=UPI000DA70F50
MNNKKGTRGRKSLEESKKRNNVISIYLNDEDFKKVKEKAEKARLPISQYITLKIFQNED